jgi:hypothetical protein
MEKGREAEGDETREGGWKKGRRREGEEGNIPAEQETTLEGGRDPPWHCLSLFQE